MTADKTAPPAVQTAVPPEGATSPRTWRIEMPAGLKLLNANDRYHWAPKARIVRELRKAAWALTKAAKVPHLDRAQIDCIYEPPDRRSRDAANWADSAKPCVDGITDAGVLTDDSSAFLEGPFMHIGDRYPGGRLVLIITELPEGLPNA
jgi:crossover junction endodeoxyribonuclease RusA